MANIKISDLPAAVAAQLAMEFEVNDNGTSRRVSGAQIDTLVLGATNGFVARTGTNARAARTLTAGTGIAVSNGNGASGNPTVALSTAAQASLGKAESAVQPARAILAGTGLSGGGDLSADRTVALSAAAQASLDLANSAVQPARALTAGAGLIGGGDLSSNRSFAADLATSAHIRALDGTNKLIATQAIVPAASAITPSGGTDFTPDWSAFINATWEITANRTLNNPINVIPGTTRTLYVKATGSNAGTLSFGSNYGFTLDGGPISADTWILYTLFALSDGYIMVSAVRWG